VTELQVTACVFGPNHAFHLIAKGLMVCLFSRGLFVWLTVLPLQGFEVWNHPPLIFEHDMFDRSTFPVRRRSKHHDRLIVTMVARFQMRRI